MGRVGGAANESIVRTNGPMTTGNQYTVRFMMWLCQELGILKKIHQTSAMKTDLEPELLQHYSDLCNVNVLPIGFVIYIYNLENLNASQDFKSLLLLCL